MTNEEICATWADPLDRLAGTLYERDLGIWRAGVQSWQDAEGFLLQLERAEAVRGAAYPAHQRIEILCTWRDAEIRARAEEDRANGAALRALGSLLAVDRDDRRPKRWRVVTYERDGFGDTLPEAVFKALGPVGT